MVDLKNLLSLQKCWGVERPIHLGPCPLIVGGTGVCCSSAVQLFSAANELRCPSLGHSHTAVFVQSWVWKRQSVTGRWSVLVSPQPQVDKGQMHGSGPEKVQDDSLNVLHQASRWCQCYEFVPEGRGNKIIGNQNSSPIWQLGSQPFPFRQRARTIPSLTPDSFSEALIAQKNSQHLQSLFPPHKSSRQTWHCIMIKMSNPQSFAFSPIHPCRWCLFI